MRKTNLMLDNILRTKRAFLVSLASLIIFVPMVSSVVAQSNAVTGFTLIDATLNQPVVGYDPIPDNATFDMSTLPDALTLRANTSPAIVGSVRFGLNANSNFQVESQAPYALNGDTNGNYNAWTLSLGSHTVTAIPYSEAGGAGTAGEMYTLNFTIMETDGAAPTPIPTSISPIDACWADSFSVNNQCYCNSNLDHNENGYLEVEIDTPSGLKTVREICQAHEIYAIPDGTRTYYNDVQCGNGPANSAPDEQICPAIPGSSSCNSAAYQGPMCFQSGPTWDLSMFNVPPSESGTITGELRKWHKVTVLFTGPMVSETGSPNPFLDYRLNVTFIHPGTGKEYVVPGHFAADGDAANTSAVAGTVWRVHFSPDELGEWEYQVSFREGPQVAVSTTLNAGVSAGYMDGASGSFKVLNTDKVGRDFRGKGRLQYVGDHYLRFAETGEYFLKGGADSPENFLAYEDFDNTTNVKGLLKSWSPHATDYNNDGPTWQNGKGTEIAGAINYLSSKGMNVFSFLTMNINGDDDNVFPYVTKNGNPSPSVGYLDARTRFDISKLDQWSLVFEHGTMKGMYLHFKLQETENDQLLDGGNLEVERKVYYREMVSRFGHNLALNWNLSEEFNPGSEAQRLREYSAYFKEIDPYLHHIVVHTYPGDHQKVYGAIVDEKVLTGISVQTSWNNVFSATSLWRNTSASSADSGAGQKWVVANDEQGSSLHGVPPDSGCTGAPSQANIRHQTLWGNLMAGGAGVEYYFGYNCNCTDLTCQDYRSRDAMWDYTRHALTFSTTYLPFWEMENDNQLTSVTNDFVFAKPGEIYAVYLPVGGTTELTVSAGLYSVRWYNPRTGGSLQEGSISTINGPGSKSIGNPPTDSSSDWVVLVTNQLNSPTPTNTPEETPITGTPAVTPNPTSTSNPQETPITGTPIVTPNPSSTSNPQETPTTGTPVATPTVTNESANMLFIPNMQN